MDIRFLSALMLVFIIAESVQAGGIDREIQEKIDKYGYADVTILLKEAHEDKGLMRSMAGHESIKDAKEMLIRELKSSRQSAGRAERRIFMANNMKKAAMEILKQLFRH